MAVVSVIIPLYNKEKYVRRALDSICAQTFDDFEVIVVDDGSTDEGPDIVRKNDDPRLRLIQQANAGPAAARNRGVRESTAAYLTFLDADDEWLPKFLETSLEMLECHPGCSVSLVSRYEGPLRVDRTPKFKQWGFYQGKWSLSESRDVRFWENLRNMFFTGAVMCKREDFERLGGFYDKKRTICGEDTYLWLQFAVNCKIFLICKPLVWYHIEASGLACSWRDAGVVQPYLSDPDPIRRNCPSEHRALLEDLITNWAFSRAALMCECQDAGSARQICRAFPAMKQSVWKYAKLRIKMRFPRAYRTFRRARVNSRVAHQRGDPHRNDSLGVRETECSQESS